MIIIVTSGKKKPTGGVSLFGDDVLPKKDKPAEKVPFSLKTILAYIQSLSIILFLIDIFIQIRLKKNFK